MLPRQALLLAHALVSALIVAGALLLRHTKGFWPFSGEDYMFASWVYCNLVPLTRFLLPELVLLHYFSGGIAVEAAKVLLCDLLEIVPAKFARWRLCLLGFPTPTESPTPTAAQAASGFSSSTLPLATAAASVAASPSFPIPLTDSWFSPCLHALLLLVMCLPLLIEQGNILCNSLALGFVVWAYFLVSKGRFFLGGAAFACALNFSHTSVCFAAGFGFWLLRLGFDLAPPSIYHLESVDPGDNDDDDSDDDDERGPSNSTLILFDRNSLLPAFSFGCAFVLATVALWLLCCAEATQFRPGSLLNLAHFRQTSHFWATYCTRSCATGVLTVDLELFVKSVLRPSFPDSREDGLGRGAMVLGMLPVIVGVVKCEATATSLRWGLFASALVFSLKFYQVHEKGIVLPLLSLFMLGMQHPKILSALTFALMFSMYPLILKDGLAIPYFLAQCVGVGIGIRMWGWISLFSAYVLLCACFHTCWLLITSPAWSDPNADLSVFLSGCAFFLAWCAGMVHL